LVYFIPNHAQDVADFIFVFKPRDRYVLIWIKTVNN